MKYVLMSLKEEYYNKIIEGTKKYEYRSRYTKDETVAFIYISRTKKKIVAKIYFGKPNYLENKKVYAIPVLKIEPINEIPFEELKQKFNITVPQSWYYLGEDKQAVLNHLLEKSF